jgi:hypothetical protein
MRESVLYFPHIEIQNKQWLKSSLLLWDSVYRIVPQSYAPRDDDETRQAVDAGLVRAVNLEDSDVRGFASEFQDFVKKLPFLPSGLEDMETAQLHPDKVDAHLYPFLEQYAVGESEHGWIELPRDIVRGYMFFLANQVARRRNLARCTDDKYSYAISPYFSEEANFGELLYDREAAGFYSSLLFTDLLPIEISSVPMRDVIGAMSRTKDERAEFRQALLKFTAELHKCESMDHAATIFLDYKRDLLAAKDRLKAAQGFMNKDDIGCLFSVGIPTTLSAYGALVSGTADPFGLYTIGSSLLIGAVAAYFDYKRTRSVTDNPYGAAYLICLDKEFAGSGRYPAFDRYLEEFVND